MSKLTFDSIRKILNKEDKDFNDGVVVQFLQAKASKPEDKIYGKGTVSGGNFSVYTVIKGIGAKAAEETYGTYEINNFDIVKFSKWSIKKLSEDKPKHKAFIILSGPYKILRTGLTSKIGNPRSYYDFKDESEFPDPDPKNTIIKGEISNFS